jgi:hypothetical protein
MSHPPMIPQAEVDAFRRFVTTPAMKAWLDTFPQRTPRYRNPPGAFDSRAGLARDQREERDYEAGVKAGVDQESNRGRLRKAWTDLEQELAELNPETRDKLNDLVNRLMESVQVPGKDGELPDERAAASVARSQTRDELPENGLREPRGSRLAADRATAEQKLDKMFGTGRIGIGDVWR